jgi:hypothetical protein
MDEKERVDVEDVYEPPEVVEVGSVSNLTGQDGTIDADSSTDFDT